MRKLVFHLQTTLNNCTSKADGTFWEPFPWGEQETARLNEHFRQADTWVLSRKFYEAIVPWWDQVAAGETPTGMDTVTSADREFGRLQHRLTKVVFSNTLESDADRLIIGGDIAAELAALKQRPGKDILMSCGPSTLAPLAMTPGLIDEYLLAVSPAVVGAGPRLFEDVTDDLALQLVDSTVFNRGALLLRYRVVE
ncbi:dihydrofolate reductase family protein [Nonomuraea sp. NPDC059007]|uniref:dihydrofolate reductase family protein n=1 Tax=Nonomuraea sp. NPDC059007 TaxID=3346692 RepID=UPI00369AC578